MIKSWKHKRLQKFFEEGSLRGIQPHHTKRLTLILQRLNAAVYPEDLNLPGMQFHQLSGKSQGNYAVAVNGNWRVIYQFEGNNAILVDYLDYH